MEIPVSFYIYMSFIQSCMHYSSSGSTHIRPVTLLFLQEWPNNYVDIRLCFSYLRMQELCSCIPEDLGNPDLRVKAVSDLVMNPTAFSSLLFGRVKTAGKSLSITALLIQLSVFDRGGLPLSAARHLMCMNVHVWLEKKVCVCLLISACLWFDASDLIDRNSRSAAASFIKSAEWVARPPWVLMQGQTAASKEINKNQWWDQC